MQAQLEALKAHLQEVYDLAGVSALLNWDQNTGMPPGGGAARGRQIALVDTLYQEKLTNPEIGKLLDKLEAEIENTNTPYESDEAALVRVTRRMYERAIKIPASFVAEQSAHSAAAFEAWREARPQNDFKKVQPYLEKSLELSRQEANYFPGYDHIADPLIDQADYGMKAQEIKRVFAELRDAIVPMVKAIAAQTPPDDSFLRLSYPVDKQFAFAEEVIAKFGYDFNRGRRDLAPHPFATKFSIGDVRITTRADEHHLGDGLFATFHESGHAMYEQGLNPDYEGTMLARGTSSGVHESQSRSWENLVGRSRGFWEYYYPKLQAVFPDNLSNVDLETFYRAINRVQQSLIRVAADEVTYNLHVMLRFDLELEMLEGTLAIKDLPEAWNARYQSDLGVTPPSDTNGVLQDIHWYGFGIGGLFQGYTLGNIMSAQFYNAALKAHPSIPDEIKQGEFSTLFNWLHDNIYQHGRKFTANELLERLTGGPLDVQPLVNYLKAKYGEIYEL